ncbi:protein FLUORESCENT IN BLUE LIGHT, chloroplastic-like isoform X1 [Silene latifolia]|uniref:protein FLUORESCENT IN BLUE LIGHT, chloroplastic-like isoform X1 n=1 Tax=Silene latifolia TaxID=37657 RepID=UPI003D78AA90
MLFHCSSVLGPPKLPAFSSWHHFFSTKFHFQGMVPSNPRNLILPGRYSTSRPPNTCSCFAGESSTSQLLNMFQMYNSGNISIHTSQQLSEITSLCPYVNQEAHFTRLIAIVLLSTNATLMSLAMPLEALAETCETDNSIFNMPLLLLVALVGATVGGLLARQRRGELQKLNEQLRQINAALRRQAVKESYAPALSYAPVGGRVAETEVIVDPKKEELISRLKNGKKYLRNLDPDKALTEFKIALELAQELKDPIEEKKAARGLGASLQRQGKYREAINYHKMVLGISKRVKETSGNTEAYGAIADCYTELGDLENAAKFYDKYIARLETD